MKKGKKTYLLLVLVLFIWGILGFKIIGALNPDNETQAVVSLAENMDFKEIKKRDTFSVSANYRDPFLGTPPESNAPHKKPIKRSKKLELPKKHILYSGSIGQNGTKNRMYFVTIDGQQHIMSKNEKNDGVTLVRGSSESITVKYPGRTETISLQQ